MKAKCLSGALPFWVVGCLFAAPAMAAEEVSAEPAEPAGWGTPAAPLSGSGKAISAASNVGALRGGNDSPWSVGTRKRGTAAAGRDGTRAAGGEEQSDER